MTDNVLPAVIIECFLKNINRHLTMAERSVDGGVGNIKHMALVLDDVSEAIASINGLIAQDYDKEEIRKFLTRTSDLAGTMSQLILTKLAK